MSPVVKWSCDNAKNSWTTSVGKLKLGEVFNPDNGGTRVLLRVGWKNRVMGPLHDNSLVRMITLASSEMWRRCSSMTTFEFHGKQEREKLHRTDYTPPSIEDQGLILEELQTIAHEATLSSEWVVWTLISDCYTLDERRAEIDNKLTWHTFVEKRIGIHGADQCQAWIIPHNTLENMKEVP
jgi:hypothetical protein